MELSLTKEQIKALYKATEGTDTDFCSLLDSVYKGAERTLHSLTKDNIDKE